MVHLPRRSAKIVTLAATFVMIIMFSRILSCCNDPQRACQSQPLERIQDRLRQWILQATSNQASDWSRFAYVQYATNNIYLCNAVMMFESLHRLQSKADRLLLYPSWMTPMPGGNGYQEINSRLLRKARDEYGVKLKAVEIQQKPGNYSL